MFHNCTVLVLSEYNNFQILLYKIFKIKLYSLLLYQNICPRIRMRIDIHTKNGLPMVRREQED